MNAIVSVTKTWGIGLNNKLLIHNPKDMQFFKNKTTGGCIICGKTTFESFPNGALPNRLNIVISHTTINNPSIHIANSIYDAINIAHKYYDTNNVWVVGGTSIYEQMLPYCRYTYVTKHDIIKEADTYFPNLDININWLLTEAISNDITPDNIPFSIVKYTNINPKL